MLSDRFRKIHPYSTESLLFDTDQPMKNDPSNDLQMASAVSDSIASLC